jgi:hypothetical protein
MAVHWQWCEKYNEWLAPSFRHHNECTENDHYNPHTLRKQLKEALEEIEKLGGFVAEMQPELGKLKTENERLHAKIHQMMGPGILRSANPSFHYLLIEQQCGSIVVVYIRYASAWRTCWS